MKVEYVYGDRAVGKTKELLEQINDRENIGIVCCDAKWKKYFQENIHKIYGERLKNIKYLVRDTDCYGNHFNKVFIDVGEYVDVSHWLFMLKDSMAENGGKVTVYYRTPTSDFDVRIIPRPVNKGELTINETSEKADKTIRKIANALVQFAQETGCRIDTLSAEYIYEIGKGIVGCNIDREMKLEEDK